MSNLFGSLGGGAQTASGLYGIAQGIKSGTALGGVQAAAGAANLANREGAFGGAPNAQVSGGLGAVSGALGLYNGLRQGGVQGYGGAAVGGLRAAAGVESLAGNNATAGALGSAAGYVAAPLSLYNAIANYQSGDTAGDTIRGAEAGAAVGSVVPVVGTAIGAVIGGTLGAISSAFGPGKVDPENANFNQMTQLYNQYGSQGVNAITNKYLSLAGLFDLRGGQIKGNIPIYSQYGRMGEQKFTTDMTSQINGALKNGTISKNDNAQSIMNKVVQPWINSFGKGQMNDANSGAISTLLTGMVNDYITGNYKSSWKAVGGDNPFSDLPEFGSAASPQTTYATRSVGGSRGGARMAYA